LSNGYLIVKVLDDKSIYWMPRLSDTRYSAIWRYASRKRD